MTEINDDGVPWGFVENDAFVPVPKGPMLRAGLGPPPFDVPMWDESIRHIIEQPQEIPCNDAPS